MNTDLLTALWPKWKPTDQERGLWTRRTSGMKDSILTECIEQERCASRGREPSITRIMDRYRLLDAQPDRLRAPKPTIAEQAAIERAEFEEDYEHAMQYLGDLTAEQVDAVLPDLVPLMGHDSRPYPMWSSMRRQLLAVHCVRRYRRHPPTGSLRYMTWWRNLVAAIEQNDKTLPPTPPNPEIHARRVRELKRSEADATSARDTSRKGSCQAPQKPQESAPARLGALGPRAFAPAPTLSIQPLLTEVIDGAARGEIPAWMQDDNGDWGEM